ncbi:MAG: response regulator transcription factor [Caldilineaceae bacterium]
MKHKIRVILVDDHPVVRAGIRTLLAGQPNIEVVGETSDGAQVIPMIYDLSPDVLVLDVQLPGINGVEIARQIKAAQLPVNVLALSAHDDIQYIRNLLAQGAAGYLTKEEAADTIVDAVLGIARGEHGWLSHRAAAQMSAWVQDPVPGQHELTNRELDVLHEIVNGLSNQEIGRKLSISEKTVEKHVSAILAKLNVSSRVEAAVLAVRENLV